MSESSMHNSTSLSDKFYKTSGPVLVDLDSMSPDTPIFGDFD